MTKSYSPGQKVRQSDQYEIIGPRGGDTGKERTLVKEKPFPPMPRSGQRYELVDKTKH